MAIHIISAGAGSGKTYRLSEEMVERLKAGTARPDGIIATTFTNKAAAELQERVRKVLLEKGMKEQADALTSALIGTVHGLGVKLLKRFAYEAGVSPEVSIIAEEDHQLLFNNALTNVLTEERVEAMEQLVIQLSLQVNRFDWRSEVRKLTELARANNFSSEELIASKERSFQEFLNLLGLKEIPQEAPETWQQRLQSMLSSTLEAIDTEQDSTKTTQKVIQEIKMNQRELQLNGRITWRNWAKLSKLKAAKKSREAVEPLCEFAKGHYRHPHFLQDIQSFISHLFDMAIAAIEEYEAYKKQRGFIDYTDMEVLVNQLLDHPRVGQILREELKLLMVDEFQDTSPIQLEIFRKLSAFADESVWVGDPKQSIYGFRGADPRLMQAILDEIPEDRKSYQQYSWRSREDLVNLSNALFSKAFSGLKPEQIVLKPKRKKKADPDSSNRQDEPASLLHPLWHWHFRLAEEEGKKSRPPGGSWMENGIAEALRELLTEGKFHFCPKKSEQPQVLYPGDIAILCRTNRQCLDMARALHRAGLKASMARSGLLETAEARLILACLKYLLNRKDSLSVAEILLLAEGNELEEIIEDRLEYLEDRSGWWANEAPIIRELDRLRHRSADLSSNELLDLVLEELDLRRIIICWGSPDQRLDNVDQLRQFSQAYEEGCTRMHTASSLGGFLLWLDQLARRQEDDQASGEHRDAINVLTYHRSKGLEWPLVICHCLDEGLRADVWGLDLIPHSNHFDTKNLLSNHWIRYWIQPYGRAHQQTYLQERVDASEAYQNKRRAALAEECRLLYVGLTRARDYLIFPSAYRGTPWLNRAWHEGVEDHPTLDTESSDSPWVWAGQPLAVNLHIYSFPREFAQREVPAETIRYWAPQPGRSQFPDLQIDAEKEDIIPLPEKEKIQLGSPTYYTTPMLIPEESEKYRIAKALKAFLMGYQTNLSESHLHNLAQGLLERYELSDVLSPGLLLSTARNWYQHLELHTEQGTLQRKVPLTHFYRDRRFETYIDYLIVGEKQVYVIQNSGFSGPKPRWKEKLTKLSDWFFLVNDALMDLYPGRSIKSYANLVLHGVTIKLDLSAVQKEKPSP